MLADEDIRRFMDAIVIMSEKSSETRQANRISDNQPEAVSNSTLQHTENQDVEQPSSSQSKAEPVVPTSDIPAPDPIEITKVNAASATILPPVGPKSHESPLYAYLNSSQIALLCDIILDTEKFEQANFEIRRLQANSADDLSLKEPFVELSGDERKKIRRIVTEPAMQKALLRLRDEFDTACNQGGDAMFALPQPFTSLQPSDREALRPLIQSPEHRAYTVYCQQRREAMLTAQPLPSEISTRLSGKEKKAIRKQLRDRRALAYVGSLLAGVDRPSVAYVMGGNAGFGTQTAQLWTDQQAEHERLNVVSCSVVISRRYYDERRKTAASSRRDIMPALSQGCALSVLKRASAQHTTRLPSVAARPEHREEQLVRHAVPTRTEPPASQKPSAPTIGSPTESISRQSPSQPMLTSERPPDRCAAMVIGTSSVLLDSIWAMVNIVFTS